MYVFDTSPFYSLFQNYYRGRFPTLWQNFDVLIAEEAVTSTREVRRELDRYAHVDDEWVQNHRAIFVTPDAAEAQFVREIYRVHHFQQNIELKKLQNGGLNADPFVIARAGATGGTVVTLERAAANSARIPNICQHFGIRCFNLEEFMEEEGWEF